MYASYESSPPASMSNIDSTFVTSLCRYAYHTVRISDQFPDKPGLKMTLKMTLKMGLWQHLLLHGKRRDVEAVGFLAYTVRCRPHVNNPPRKYYAVIYLIDMLCNNNGMG